MPDKFDTNKHNIMHLFVIFVSLFLHVCRNERIFARILRKREET